jgi:hypothetical protein
MVLDTPNSFYYYLCFVFKSLPNQKKKKKLTDFVIRNRYHCARVSNTCSTERGSRCYSDISFTHNMTSQVHCFTSLITDTGTAVTLNSQSRGNRFKSQCRPPNRMRGRTWITEWKRGNGERKSGGETPSNFRDNLSLAVSRHDGFVADDPAPRSLKENSTKTKHQNATTPNHFYCFTTINSALSFLIIGSTERDHKASWIRCSWGVGTDEGVFSNVVTVLPATLLDTLAMWWRWGGSWNARYVVHMSWWCSQLHFLLRMCGQGRVCCVRTVAV